MTAVLEGNLKAGTINGTVAAAHHTNRVGVGTGVFTLRSLVKGTTAVNPFKAAMTCLESVLRNLSFETGANYPSRISKRFLP